MSKNSGFSFVSLMLGLSIGLNGANALYHFTDDTKDKVEEAQIYNEQVERQLEGEYGRIGNIGHLVLDTGSDSFKFVLDGEQHCEGEYRVEEDRPKVVGKPECSYELGR